MRIENEKFQGEIEMCIVPVTESALTDWNEYEIKVSSLHNVIFLLIKVLQETMGLKNKS